MINQYEVPAYLADELPEIEQDLKSTSANLNISKNLQCLVSYTKTKVRQHDLIQVKKCFAVAENLYWRGNLVVKDAIENVYVYSFSTLLNMGSNDERKQLHSIMPLCLYTAYAQQIMKSGI